MENDSYLKRAGWSSPYTVAVPLLVVAEALSLRSSGMGAAGLPLGAVAGLLWALLAAFVAKRIGRKPERRARAEDVLVFCGVICAAFLCCGGVMMILLMGAALDEPSTTYRTLSAMMAPTLPYYIAGNSVMELFIVPATIFVGWRAGRRRVLLVSAALVYFASRVWTYLVYAQRRTDTATGTLSAEDVRWYKETLVVDYRVVLLGVVLILFTAAALLPARQWARSQPGDDPRTGTYDPIQEA
ncbi:hypothetical protein [Actinomadura fibrosa]|uniref:Integral membrane protein n=1 Tax=Actinomadura fibrosa TaxID=111802 RepID=A0ABW2XJX5_9ACTN|nr:hypothetical protein [Actinomadura fibrosa]